MMMYMSIDDGDRYIDKHNRCVCCADLGSGWLNVCLCKTEWKKGTGYVNVREKKRMHIASSLITNKTGSSLSASDGWV